MRITSKRSRQNGMAMVVSLVMLVLMSIIILQAARSSNLELMIGTNSLITAESLMRAEDSAVAGEARIELDFDGAPVFDFSADDGIYLDGSIDVNTVDWDQLTAEVSGTGDERREYIVEYLGTATSIEGSISVGAGAASNLYFLYRVSGRGESSKGGARVVQTIYAMAE